MTATAIPTADTFTYEVQVDRYGPAHLVTETRTSTISRELAERIADAFEADGVASTWDADYRKRNSDGKLPRAYERNAEIVALVAGLPAGWAADVDYILTERDRAKIVDTDRFTWTDVTHTRTSVIGRERAEKIAAAFEAAGIHYTSQTDRDRTDQYGNELPSYTRFPEIVALVAGLPRFWTVDVNRVLDERSLARGVAARKAQYAAVVTDPAILAYLLEHAADGGMKNAEITDETYLIKLATATDGRSKPAYQPEPGCKASLKLREAVSFRYEQDAYANYASYAVPVSIEEGADTAVCRRNLNRFAQALRTANGLAGYGSTWDADLIERPEGSFVLLRSRSNIPD